MSDTERETFQRLSMALTKGNAATWDEVIHAAEQAALISYMHLIDKAFDAALAARPVEAKGELEEARAEIKRLRRLITRGEYMASATTDKTPIHPASIDALRVLDAAKTVLSDIYKREGKSFHGSRVKADIESVMPLIDAALRDGAKEGTHE